MGSPLTIMVVDDDETSLAVTAALLEDREYRVIARSTAIGTSAAIISERPDVVLLDVEMPGITGPRLVEVLARRGEPGPICILYSARPATDVEALARACGAVGAIRKDGTPQQFVRAFEDIVARARARDADAAPSTARRRDGVPSPTTRRGHRS